MPFPNGWKRPAIGILIAIIAIIAIKLAWSSLPNIIELAPGYLPWKHSDATSHDTKPYIAPVNMPSDWTSIRLDAYIVKLKPGYTLEDHFAHIGQDLQKPAQRFFWFGGLNSHFFKMPDAFQIVQEKIRFDPGVKVVKPDFIISFNEFLRDEARLTSRPDGVIGHQENI
ncbi:hypothetical protein B0T19DRAFT_109552 [Cercophora scortea]|uniref:Uncharacterized protein n=1 Tax=Cercophora scortea TaxID=314031 RepID=A0AAE0IXE7_9PEZI|nr:hypothetical protein B0T19DRAFT_109552 [Cercophora scortea]